MAYISSVERIGIRKGLEQGLRQGLEQGLHRGLEQGRHEGMAGLLREQLELRFGPLPDAGLTRLHQADGAMLRIWARRLLEAKTLDSVWQ